jgi:hypothetical protein
VQSAERGERASIDGWIAEHAGKIGLTGAGLEGAGVISVGAGQGIAVAARVAGQPVTLVVTDGLATASAGPKRIITRVAGELNVASWTRGTRSFALVSGARSEAACTICHATPAALL